MTFKELDTYLLSKQGATFDYPFNEDVRVYRIAEKIFALTADKHPLGVNLKCDPIYALELRSIYDAVSSEEKKLLLLPRDRHSILADEKSEEVFEAVFGFIEAAK